MNNADIICRLFEKINYGKKANSLPAVRSYIQMLTRRQIRIDEIVSTLYDYNPLLSLVLIEENNLDISCFDFDSLRKISYYLVSIETEDINKISDEKLAMLIMESYILKDYQHLHVIFEKYVFARNSNDIKEIANQICDLCYGWMNEYVFQLLCYCYKVFGYDDSRKFIYYFTRNTWKGEVKNEIRGTVHEALEKGHFVIAHYFREMLGDDNSIIDIEDLFGITDVITSDNILRWIFLTEDVCLSTESNYKQWYDRICEKLERIDCYDDDIRNLTYIYYVSKLIQQGEYDCDDLKDKNKVAVHKQYRGTKRIKRSIQTAIEFLFENKSDYIIDYLLFLGDYNYFKYDTLFGAPASFKTSINYAISWLNSLFISNYSEEDIIYIFMNTNLRKVIPFVTFIDRLTSFFHADVDCAMIKSEFEKYPIPILVEKNEDGFSLKSDRLILDNRVSIAEKEYIQIQRVIMEKAELTFSVGFYVRHCKQLKIVPALDMPESSIDFVRGYAVHRAIKNIGKCGFFDEEEFAQIIIHNDYNPQNVPQKTRCNFSIEIARTALSLCANENTDIVYRFFEILNSSMYINEYKDNRITHDAHEDFKCDLEKQWISTYLSCFDKNLLLYIYFNTVCKLCIPFAVVIKTIYYKTDFVRGYQDFSHYRVYGNISKIEWRKSDRIIHVNIGGIVGQYYTDISPKNLEILGYKRGAVCNCYIKSYNREKDLLVLLSVSTKKSLLRQYDYSKYLQKLISLEAMTVDDFPRMKVLCNEIYKTYSPHVRYSLSKMTLYFLVKNIKNSSVVNKFFVMTAPYNPYVFSASQMNIFERMYRPKEEKDVRTSKFLLMECLKWSDYRMLVFIYFNTIMRYEYSINEFIRKVKNSNKDIEELIPWFSDYVLLVRNSNNRTPINFHSDKYVFVNEKESDDLILACVVVGLRGSTLALKYIENDY